MTKPLLPKNKAQALSTALLLVGLAILLFTDAWWPGILLAVGIPLALKQLLNGRYYDAIISLFVFVGFFIIASFDISWKILVPILFVMAAVFTLCKEWVTTSTDEEEDVLREIVLTAYPIERDDQWLRELADQPAEERAAYFDHLRATYLKRREFNATTVALSGGSAELAAKVAALGFQVV